ncbi:nucleotidyltransferase family protein [Hydrogenimonas sp.]|jgi:predicted nucleotidyltransferase|uniref:nucleotidyltransferase family protein n=1 Tax=Hydrogenimonas sp. TaxID=2231112 RepID=UPI00263631EA|nr:nucleotidyltransferase family protein [Hydrogenimonas sp.]
MHRREEIIDYLRRHRKELKEKFHVKKIGLFGSFARNEQKISSDIDLIIELEENVSHVFTLKRELSRFLEKELGRPVDIAREKYIKPYAKETILKETIYV